MDNSGCSQMIYDVQGNLLIKAGQEISEYLIEKIINENKIESPQIVLSQTRIIGDLITAIDAGIYRVIFAEKKDTEQIIDIFKTTCFAELIIQELEKLKYDLPQTYYHILVVAALSMKICLDLNIQVVEPYKIVQIGLVHDIGKSRLPFSILGKNTPLTHEEFEIIKTHPWIDHLLVSHYLNSTKSIVAQAALMHHERLDGSGYPLGLEKISSYVQAIIPCDIFDALIAQRPYRSDPFTVRAALDLLLAESKKGKINNKFVRCLISYARKEKPHFYNVKISEENRDPPPRINYYGVRQE